MEPNLGHSVINPLSIVSIKWPCHPLNMHVFSTERSKSQRSHALKNIQLIWDKSKERTEKAPACQGGGPSKEESLSSQLFRSIPVRSRLYRARTSSAGRGRSLRMPLNGSSSSKTLHRARLRKTRVPRDERRGCTSYLVHAFAVRTTRNRFFDDEETYSHVLKNQPLANNRTTVPEYPGTRVPW